MYDDEDDDEEEAELDIETARREGAEVSRGKEERAFYDDLAKKEDERHNAMRADLAKRSIGAGELRQKLRHKQAEIDAIAAKISIEEERIALEGKKAYQSGAKEQGVSAPAGDVAIVNTEASETLVNPEELAATAEFSVERAAMHVKQLQAEMRERQQELDKELDSLHEEERALSQLQHAIMRM